MADAPAPQMVALKRLVPLLNHSGDVYDPFAGTGSSLVAAEMRGRRWWGMEIETAYCDVIRQRYADFTGRPEFAP